MVKLFAIAFAFFLAISLQVVQAQTASQINATALSDRESWCQNQVAVCSNICQQKTSSNTCNTKTLAWVCSCESSTAKIGEDVDLTIPYYTCLEYKWRPCFNSCPPADQSCVDKCNQQYVCGSVKAKKETTATPAATPGSDPSNTTGSTVPTVSTNSAISSQIITGLVIGALLSIAALMI